MLSTKSGMAACLTKKSLSLYLPLLNHCLELAVADSVKTINAANHFQVFMNTVYVLYSQSSKNCQELREVADELETSIRKIGWILGIHWVASSTHTLKAVWDAGLHRK
jgi:hypothetical protein